MSRQETLRRHLARADAVVVLAILGLAAGVIVGLTIIVFRLLTEQSPVWIGLLPAVERYEALPPAWRFGLPAGGGLLLGIAAWLLPEAARAVGPAHVMVRLATARGRLPWLNAAWQFIGGGASIIVGQSVGREGPVIHVGAAAASLLGQRLDLPNNSIRALVAAGVAGAIGASFNTPLAGVIFAMEVVMLEYTLLGFTPVILAAVSATAISQLAFGREAPLHLPPMQLGSLLEFPWIVVLGAVIGVLAAAYVKGVVGLDRSTRRWPVVLRITLAGVVVGLIARWVPEVMGLGYDTVQTAMTGGFVLGALAVIALAKLAATIACGGLGMPGGAIGPMVVIGACAGGAIGIVGHQLAPLAGVTPAFYAALGAVAMMGACLHAPLAALTAILELTANPNTILPGMAAVTTAFLVARVGLRQPPLFVALVANRGIDYRPDPRRQALDRAGVAAVMQPLGALPADARPGRADAPAAGATGPAHGPGETVGAWWLGRDAAMLAGVWPAAAVERWRTETLAEKAAEKPAAGGQPADAEAIPAPAPANHWPPDAERARVVAVPVFATLGEAQARLDAEGADVALVIQGPVEMPATGLPEPLPRSEVLGLLDRRAIDDWIESGAGHGA